MAAWHLSTFGEAAVHMHDHAICPTLQTFDHASTLTVDTSGWNEVAFPEAREHDDTNNNLTRTTLGTPVRREACNQFLLRRLAAVAATGARHRGVGRDCGGGGDGDLHAHTGDAQKHTRVHPNVLSLTHTDTPTHRTKSAPGPRDKGWGGEGVGLGEGCAREREQESAKRERAIVRGEAKASERGREIETNRASERDASRERESGREGGRAGERNEKEEVLSSVLKRVSSSPFVRYERKKQRSMCVCQERVQKRPV